VNPVFPFIGFGGVFFLAEVGVFEMFVSCDVEPDLDTDFDLGEPPFFRSPFVNECGI
jgi:hypothetical protein